METIEIDTRNGIAIVWLNRPEVRNAFNPTMVTELGDAFTRLARDRAVRALVVAARGPAFCAGADLNEMKRTANAGAKESNASALRWARMLYSLASFPKPTVARVHGAAFAGGIGLVAACDIAVAAQAAEFCVSEVKLGLVPAMMGPYVIAKIGEAAARRYFLTAERFDAAEAYRLGLVQELASAEELDATINGILGHVIEGAPGAHAGTKALIREALARPIDATIVARSAKRNAQARMSAEGKEGVRAFLERRKPAWVEPAKPPRTKR